MSVVDGAGWSVPDAAAEAACDVWTADDGVVSSADRDEFVEVARKAVAAAMEEMETTDFVRAVKTSALMDERDWWADQWERWDRDSKDPEAVETHGKEYLMTMRAHCGYAIHHIEAHAVSTMHGEERE